MKRLWTCKREPVRYSEYFKEPLQAKGLERLPHRKKSAAVYRFCSRIF